MTKRNFWTGLCAGLAAFAFVAMPAIVQASSHREAPAISRDPAADNTDVYAWVSPGAHDKLYLIGNWIPLEEPAGGPNYHSFSDNVRYEFHLARGNKSLEDAVTYYIQFRTKPGAKVKVDGSKLPLVGGHQFFSQLSGAQQTYSVWKIKWNGRSGRATIILRDKPVAPVNIGPRTNALVYQTAKYDEAFTKKFVHTATDNSRIFAGPRADIFFVDLGATFDLANLRPLFATDLKADPPQNHVAKNNTHTIALEIPTTELTVDGKAPVADATTENSTLGIWAASSRRRITFRDWGGRTYHFGSWVQVSRLGFPLVNEAVIGLQDKDRFNSSHPAYDVPRFGSYILNPVVVQDADAVGIYKLLKADSTAFQSNRTDIVTDVINLGKNIPLTASGDVLRLDMAKDSGFPNGRHLLTDVTDIIVAYVLAKAPGGKGNGPNGTDGVIVDGVDKPDVTPMSEFPFMPIPHEGYSGGKGEKQVVP